MSVSSLTTPQPQPAPQTPAQAIAAVRASLEALAARAGQVVAATVVGTAANGVTQLSLGTQTLTLQLSAPLPAGTPVQITVQPTAGGTPAIVVQPLPAGAPGATPVRLPPAPPSPPMSAAPAPPTVVAAGPAPGTVGARPNAPQPAPMPPVAPASPTAPAPAAAATTTGTTPGAAATPAADTAMPPTPAPRVPAAPAPVAPSVIAGSENAARPSPATASQTMPASTGPSATQPATAPSSSPSAPSPTVVSTVTVLPSAPPASAGQPLPSQPAAAGTPATTPSGNAASPALLSSLAAPSSPPVTAAPPAPASYYDTVISSAAANTGPIPASGAGSATPQSTVAAPMPLNAPSTPAAAAATAAVVAAPTVYEASPAATAATPMLPAATPPRAVPASPYPVAPAAATQTAANAVSPTTTLPLAQPAQAAARQDSIVPLLQNLAAVRGTVAAMAPPIAEAAARLLATRLPIDRGAPTAAALKSAIEGSGVFLQQKSVAQAPTNDVKSSLLQLRSSLLSFIDGADISPVAPVGRRPPPPVRDSQPRAVLSEPPSLSPEAAPREAAKTILHQTDAALSRLKLTQLAAQPDLTRPGSGGPSFMVELPLALGAETALMQLQVQRDSSSRNKAQARGWRVRFAVSFAAIGEVGAQISLFGHTTNVLLWADEAATADAIEQLLPDLAPALAARGLEAGSVRLRRGAPPAERPVSGRLMDESL